jgi:hypothetical protein
MTVGRTVGKFTKFQISDSASTMRDIPVTSYGNVGLTFAEQDVSALQDLVTSVLNGQGAFSTTITGPFDTTAAATCSSSGVHASLSGSHTILAGLNGGQVAKSFGIYLGIQGDWVTGDPVFGGIKCILVSDYTVDPAAGTYSAKISIAGNRTNDPAWQAAEITATS